MNKLSIKAKIMLWFSATLLILVLIMGATNIYVSRYVLDQSIKERLVTLVTTSAEDIEYYNSNQSINKSYGLTLSYNGGIVQIDDDFCDYYEGVCTALVDSDNNLLYGESPIDIPQDKQFTFLNVGTIEANGNIYYVYEKPLTASSLDGLWLRGVISEQETIYMLDNIINIEMLLLPVIVLITLLGGFVVTKRSFLPIESITNSVNDIVDGADLSKRIDIGEGNDEIHQLAKTFNNMFNRLEKSFETEKQFTSDASHELRTPISIIKANCEYALEFAKDENEYIETLQVINRQSDIVTNLLSQLLFFTKLEQGTNIHFINSNLSNLVTDLCSDRQLLLDNERIISLTVQKDIILSLDESLITRLLNNLLDNAVKYSPEGSTIEVSLYIESNMVNLSVKDYGIGISPENIQKIWDRFYQEDSARTISQDSGCGLGLSIVKEIADLHKGSLSVESKLGHGSKFTLTIPLQ